MLDVFVKAYLLLLSNDISVSMNRITDLIIGIL